MSESEMHATHIARRLQGSGVLTLRVGDVMTTDVYVTRADTTLFDLDRELTDRQIGGAPVVDDKGLVGVVSRVDVVGALLEDQRDASRISAFYSSPYPLSMGSVAKLSADTRKLALRLGQARVGDVMSTDLLTAEPDEDLRAVAVRMAARQIHRLPVVESDELVGIITALDFVSAVAAHGLSGR